MFKLKPNSQKQGNAIPKQPQSQSHGFSRSSYRRHSRSGNAVNQSSSSSSPCLGPGSRPEILQQGSRSLSPLRKLKRHRRLASSPQDLPGSKLFQLKKNKASSNIRGKLRLDSESGHGSHPLSPSRQGQGQGQGQGPFHPLAGNRQEGGHINDSNHGHDNGRVLIENIENISQAIQFPASESHSLSDEELSKETQESEYKIDCSSKYTNQSYERLTCFVYKRKAGFSGLMKTKYAVASERSKHLGNMVHQNIHMNKDFWKLGMGKGTSVGTINETTVQDKHVDVVVSAGPPIKMWERRRLVLEGKHLMYFHEDADFEEEDYGGLTMSKRHQLAGLKRLKDKFNEFAEHAHLKPPSQGAINNPKGVIDLVAEYATATVVPITPNSFAPTPYCLAIMVKSEVKWMLCFDDEKEIMKWLRNLTKVTLTQSVERFAKNRGKYYNAQVLKSDSGERKRAMSPIVEIKDIYRTPNVDNRVAVVMSTHDINNSSINIQDGAISDRFMDSTKTLVDRESCKIVCLVNSTFLYLFLVVEEALALSHMFVFALVNICAWLHLRKTNTTKRLSSEEEGVVQLEHDPLAQSHSSSFQVCKSESMVSTEEFLCESPTDRNIIVSSSSFIERRKSVEDEDIDRPIAGETTQQVQTMHESHSHEKQKEMITWMVGDPSIIQLRGQDYLTTKQKFPSATSLYELVELDAFDSDEHVTDVGQRFQFPGFDYGEEGNWCAPDTLIISFALPTTAPKLGRSGSDGKGYIVCGYYRIRAEVRKTLQIISNVNYDDAERNRRLRDLFPTSKERVLVNGVKLWEKWCRGDPEMQKRLKFIPRGENLKELGVPSWICRYNGKPMLIKRPGETSFVFSHPDERTLEIDVNLHPLPFMFKQAMSYLKDHYFGRMLMTFGFVIEGREEDELPEVLLGSPMHLDKPSTVLKSAAVFAKSSF